MPVSAEVQVKYKKRNQTAIFKLLLGFVLSHEAKSQYRNVSRLTAKTVIVTMISRLRQFRTGIEFVYVDLIFFPVSNE